MTQAIQPHAETPVLEENLLTREWLLFLDDLIERIGGEKDYSLGGVLTVDYTAVGNVGGGADDLISYSLLANTMSSEGDTLSIDAFGTFAANANNKTLILYLGSTALFTTGAIASNATDWHIHAEIIRTGAATQVCSTVFSGDTVLVTTTSNYAAGTEDFTTALTIKCTGTGTSDNDIQQAGLIIKYFTGV